MLNRRTNPSLESQPNLSAHYHWFFNLTMDQGSTKFLFYLVSGISDELTPDGSQVPFGTPCSISQAHPR